MCTQNMYFSYLDKLKDEFSKVNVLIKDVFQLSLKDVSIAY